jgi:hypothetical protein
MSSRHPSTSSNNNGGNRTYPSGRQLASGEIEEDLERSGFSRRPSVKNQPAEAGATTRIATAAPREFR